MSKTFIKRLIIIIFLLGFFWAASSFIDYLAHQGAKGARKVRSSSNLEAFEEAALKWSQKNGGNLPESLKQLIDSGFLDLNLVFHPLDSDVQGAYQCIFELCGNQLKTSDIASGIPLAWESKEYFIGERAIITLHSKAKYIPEEDFQKLMAEKILPFVEAQKKKGEE